MSEIKDWAIGIIGFILIMSIVSHLVNGRKFFKYIRFFMGLILVLIVIKPVSSFFDLDKKLEDFLNSYGIELSINDLQSKLELSLDEFKDNYIESYKEAIRDKISDIVKNDGYDAVKIDADVNEDNASEDYGRIEGLKIYLKAMADSASIKVDKIKIGEAVDAVSQLGARLYNEIKDKIKNEFKLNDEEVDIYIEN
ncbi:MAG: stage III sporulation protein AF [Lachnospiraceae bacterium]|nr:stage III sporulation protein AF [Lachnospiraceae bacterium]